MRNLKRKGFTLVELVIVIAVVAVLAAVLIPTFVKLTRKANMSTDTQLVRNLNTALSTDVDGHATMHDALEAAKEFGYDIAKINAKAEGNKILWDSKNDCFAYLDVEKDELIYVPDTKIEDPAGVDLWIISDTVHADYSTYLYGYTETTVTTSKGIDTSGVPTITSVTYNNTVNQNAIIRTNSAFTNLTINDTSEGTTYHYGSAGALDIITCHVNSYHENGNVGFAEISKGRIVLESGSSIKHIHVKGAEVIIANNTNKALPELTGATGVSNVTVEDNPNKVVIDELTDDEKNEKKQEVVDEAISKEIESLSEKFYARIGSKGYEKLQDAINEAASGQTIVLLKDLNTTNENGTLQFKDVNVTLDLNNCSITNTDYDQRVILVSGTAIVTIKNGEIINTKGKNSNVKDTNYVAIRAQDTANLTVENVNLVSAATDAIHTAGSAIVTITGENTTVKGGYAAVKAEGSSKVYINNGKFMGGISLNIIITIWTNAQVTISGGTVEAMGTSRCVGLDYVKAAKLVVEGGTFTTSGTIVLQPYGTVNTNATASLGTGYEGNVDGDYWVVTAK